MPTETLEKTRTVQAVGEWLLVSKREVRKESEGGVIFPDAFKGESQECDVISAGEGLRAEFGEKRERMDAKIGDQLLIGKYDDREIQIDGRPHYFVTLTDVIGWLDPQPHTGDWSKRLHLYHNHILIEWERATKTLLKGVVRPDQYADMQFTGYILQIGPDVRRDKFPGLRLGQRVFFDQFGDHFRKKNWKEGFGDNESRYACILDDDLRLTNLPARTEFEIVDDPRRVSVRGRR